MRRLPLLAIAFAAAALAACGSARRGEPIVGPVALSDAGARGEKHFMRACHQCHPKGESGLAPAINDKPLPAFLIRFQVRKGLGAMPSFSPHEIDPIALDEIVTYLQELRAAG